MGSSTSSLLTAASEGQISKIQILLQKPEVLSTLETDADKDGRNALILAASNGHTELCKLLIEKYNANIEASCSTYGQTALAHATDNNHAKTVMTLLDLGAKVDPVDRFGKTPLMLASYRNYLDIALLLLKHGANVNAEDKQGETALSVACSKGHFITAHALLEKGANADICDMEGYTPLMQAASAGHLGLVNMLLHDAKITNINSVTFKNKTSALMIAVSRGSDDIVRSLLDNFADPELEDNRHLTAMRIAEVNKFRSISLMLSTFNKKRAMKVASGHFQKVHQVEGDVKRESEQEVMEEKIEQYRLEREGGGKNTNNNSNNDDDDSEDDDEEGEELAEMMMMNGETTSKKKKRRNSKRRKNPLLCVDELKQSESSGLYQEPLLGGYSEESRPREHRNNNHHAKNDDEQDENHHHHHIALDVQPSPPKSGSRSRDE